MRFAVANFIIITYMYEQGPFRRIYIKAIFTTNGKKRLMLIRFGVHPFRVDRWHTGFTMC